MPAWMTGKPRFRKLWSGCWTGEISVAGDWRQRSLQEAPGGWCFEYRNDHYPDCDDTAEALLALARVRGRFALEGRRQEALARGLAWLLGMQNPDGGWAAFDRGCDKEVLTFIPFADHNAMIDPSTPDITSRSIRALLAAGLGPREAPVRRAAGYLLRQQEEDGSWPGRWGANHIYGTGLSLRALGELASPAARDRSDALARALKRGRSWLVRGPERRRRVGRVAPFLRASDRQGARGQHRIPDGLGDAGAERGRPKRGRNHANPVWLARRSTVPPPSFRSVSGRTVPGTTTGGPGVGFPGVFYLRYHGYAQYFPLAALAAYRRLRSGSRR